MAFEKSKFIWVDSLSGPDSYGEFFSYVTLKGGNAKIRISVDGDYALFVNGKYVKSTQYGDFEHYKIYDEIDISPFAHKGESSIGIIVWHFGAPSQRYKAYEPGLIFEVLENDKVVLASDTSILSRKSPTFKSGGCKKISSQLGFSYFYDSTKEDSFPLSLGDGFKKSVLTKKACTFFPRPIREHSLLPVVLGKLVSQNDEKTSYVFDLGKECVGFLSFSLDCESQGKITVSYGECLESGHVKRHIGDRDFSIEYIAKPGHSSHTSPMLRIACQYLEISSETPIRVEKIGVIPQSYGAKRVKRELESELDSRIYDICVNTLDACMMEHYVDCPWREQCLYAFDSRNQMLSGYIAYENGNSEYARANLLLMSKDRRRDNILSICFPAGNDLSIPSFSLHYIIALWEYLEFTNDTSLIFEVDYKIREILNTFVAQEKNGLVYKLGGTNHWSFYDWSEGLEGNLYQEDGTDSDVMICLLTIYALTAYQKICEKCTLPFAYGDFLTKLRTETRKAFFNTERGLFVFKNDGRELYHSLPNSLAITLDLVDDGEKRKIASAIKNNELFRPSLSMRAFEYDALITADYQNKSFVLDEIRKEYKKMLDFGSSTVWETSEGPSAFGNAGSLCHGWSAIAIKFL